MAKHVKKKARTQTIKVSGLKAKQNKPRVRLKKS